MTYHYDLRQLAKDGKPTRPVPSGSRYDYLSDHIDLAIAERVESVAVLLQGLNTQLEVMNAHLAGLNEKMAEFVALTKVASQKTGGV